MGTKQGEENMAEVNGYGLASYIQSMQATKPVPAKQVAIDPVSSKDAAPTRSVQISISQEAIARRQSSE